LNVKISMPPNSRRTTLGGVNAPRRKSMGLNGGGGRKSIGARVKTGRDDGSKGDVDGGIVSSKLRKGRVSMLPRYTSNSKNPLEDLTNNKKASSSATTPSKKASFSDNSRRQTMAGAIPGGAAVGSSSSSANIIRVDPRPISEKAHIASSIKSLMAYLLKSGYDHPLSPKILNRPSGKDFNNIITFLLRRVDPIFNDGTLKFEDEVSLAFKALGYPFPISKTALVAVGSPHTWPGLLAALTWLIEVLSCDEETSSDNDNTRTAEMLQQQNNIDNNSAIMPITEQIHQLVTKSEKVFFHYLLESYELFLSGEDDEYEAQVQEDYIQLFRGDNVVIEREIEKVSDINGTVVESIERLNLRDDVLPEMEKKREDYCTDLEKFYGLVKQLNEHKSMLETKVTERTDELNKCEDHLRELNEKNEQISKVVENQGLSAHEARKMNYDKVRGEEEISKALAAKQEHNKSLWESEMELSKDVEKLSLVVNAYNELVQELGLVHSAQKNRIIDDDQRNYVITINRDNAGELDQRNFLGVDIINQVVPHLSQMKRAYLSRNEEGKQELLRLLDKEEEVEEVLQDISKRLDQLHEEKETTEENMNRTRKEQEIALSAQRKEVAALQSKVRSLRDPAAFEAAVSRHERQCVEVNCERRKCREEHVSKKNDIHQEINEAVDACENHKEYVQRRLIELNAHLEERENMLNCT